MRSHQSSSECSIQLKLEWQRVKRLARTANPLALVAQQQPVYYPQPNPTYYTQKPEVVVDDEASSKEKEIDKLIALISMSFKKIYKPTNNNLSALSNTRNMNIDNTSRSDRRTGYSEEEVVVQLSAEQADWRDDIDDEPEDQELEAHYIYMVKIQERQHPKQPESVNGTYLVEQGDTNITPDSSDMSNNGEEADQDDQMLQKEREFLASFIEQMKIKIDGNKQNNKSLESSNKTLREANTFLNNDLKRYQDYDFVETARLKCATAYGLLEEQKVKSEKSFSAYTEKLIMLNQNISEMKNELSAHQRTISTLSFQNEEQEKFFKTREDKEIEKYLKKAQSTNPRLYDIGCYNDSLALMLAPESDETILSSDMKIVIEQKLNPTAKRVTTDVVKFYQTLKEEMVEDLKYFKSLENEVESLQSQPETQQT
ncbi:hypothetical protein Tco_0840714 [Tanacetum coccineum]|uniref:Uncharacterized protein n=1 Tax=Tanacetum coccineum TaxID=301880 RepID=A0ABQ5AXU9_9ASTR